LKKGKRMMDESEPFREGLFSEEMGKACLTGNRCRGCGQIYFPARPLCFDCLGEELEPIRFGQEGILYSYAVTHVAAGLFKAPYYAGWIDVKEGIRVFAPLSVEEGVSLKIGMKMELFVGELWREGARSVVGYKYRPFRSPDEKD